MKKVRQNQKIRIICGNASFYTTANAINNDIGSNALFNKACKKALDETLKLNAIGIGASFFGISLQLDICI